tara:strand:- start:4188 stop:5099 length:912 start_codon:yes stop_codon:yes gene_type:complete
MSIKVEGVTKNYGEQKALDNVSLEIKPGEIVGFLGPNGAGKSTMMKIITCFIPQSAGRVEVCGFDVEKDPMNVKKHIGYLPEHNPQYLEMYVKEYLLFVAKLHGVKNAKERVKEMIDLVGLQVEQNKKIQALSKGYRQRVGLAQALLHDPDVLILDEPTTGLDPNQIVEIRNLIKTVGKAKTVMMSTHIMQEVEAICDRVIIINKGTIVADKPTAELQRQSSNVQLIEVEFDGKPGIAQLKNIKGVKKARNVKGNTFEIEADAKGDVRSDVFQFAVDNGFKVLGLQVEEQDLEAVFQRLTSSN